eukprot:Awhi_evm1s3164
MFSFPPLLYFYGQGYKQILVPHKETTTANSYCSGEQNSVRISDDWNIDYLACRDKCLDQYPVCQYFTHGVWQKIGTGYLSTRCQLYKTCKQSPFAKMSVTKLTKDNSLKSIYFANLGLLLGFTLFLNLQSKLMVGSSIGLVVAFLGIYWTRFSTHLDDEVILFLFAHQCALMVYLISMLLTSNKESLDEPLPPVPDDDKLADVSLPPFPYDEKNNSQDTNSLPETTLVSKSKVETPASPVSPASPVVPDLPPYEALSSTAEVSDAEESEDDGALCEATSAKNIDISAIGGLKDELNKKKNVLKKVFTKDKQKKPEKAGGLESAFKNAMENRLNDLGENSGDDSNEEIDWE